MIGAAGALSVGIGALNALFAPQSTKGKTAGTGFQTGGAVATSPAAANANPPAAKMSPDTFNTLIEAQGEAAQPPSRSNRAAALDRLFSALDSDGDGQITKGEFETQLGAGGTSTANAGRVFGKIDANSDGAVSIEELTAALTTKKKRGSKPGENAGQDPLLKALDAAYQKTKTLSTSSTSSVSVTA